MADSGNRARSKSKKVALHEVVDLDDSVEM